MRYFNFWNRLFKPAYWHRSFLSISKKINRKTQKTPQIFSLLSGCFSWAWHSGLGDQGTMQIWLGVQLLMCPWNRERYSSSASLLYWRCLFIFTKVLLEVKKCWWDVRSLNPFTRKGIQVLLGCQTPADWKVITF